MLAERAAREHHNATLFDNETELAGDEPDEESDFILHDDDDDRECGSREHGHSCCGGSRAVLHGGCRPLPPSRHDLGGSSKFSNDLADM